MKLPFIALLLAVAASAQTTNTRQEEAAALKACAQSVLKGLRSIADTREQRFSGKVTDASALCRGGNRALQFQNTPWVDWSQYWGTGDVQSLPKNFVSTKGPVLRGVTGALVDLEFQRVELIKFNLFDNNGTYRDYVSGRASIPGPSLKVWPELRLPRTNPFFSAVGGDGAQVCTGDLIRARTLTGICNDVKNPLMGSTGTPLARNMEFDTTFPDLALNELTRNRHNGRISLMTPDPQVISRKLFTRRQSDDAACKSGFGSDCDYQKAPFFNVLAAYWIQFMTHDWFSHMNEGKNAPDFMEVGCQSQKVNGVETPLTPEQMQKLGCRPGDRIDRSIMAQTSKPDAFTTGGKQYQARAPKTTSNFNTAWWDASQIYGYDETSLRRVQRDPSDRAKLALGSGYLPVLDPNAPALPQWRGQESAAFPDNWTIGMSFYHNLFTREHNAFVSEFRKQASKTPDADSGLRNPADAKRVIRYRDVTPDELFNAARLVVAAEIAKIHTTEWTPQLLYNEPLYKGMNANWNGLLGDGAPEVSKVLSDVITRGLAKSNDPVKNASLYSVFSSGPGIFGLGSKVNHYDITKADDVNGGVNHFGSPFNFPEEFVTVYRLHPLLPDVIDYRDIARDPNRIAAKIPIIETFEARATDAMRSRGLANWALSMGRQRLGLLTLHNHPQFMQNITIPRLESETKQIDLAALDLIRDREHGVPRFNEFRRQYGLRQLRSFDDFEGGQPGEMARELREVYGTHVCDSSKVITDAQLNDDGSPINDCLGHPNGSTVDNVEDVDTVVGWLAESTRPHGFAISETQFVVFILNASRRLYSDRFFTSGFRPEFYTQLGLNWVLNNGPGAPVMELGTPNGHRQPVSPLKRLLLRNAPELAPELKSVVNVFDPWARDRGQYYSLEWKPRPGAESDPAFTH